ncbi:neuronal alpha-10 acetylcholine receptor subunit, partial [Mytilus galloprovincialis]
MKHEQIRLIKKRYDKHKETTTTDVECNSTTKQIYDAIFTGYDSGLRPVCDGVTLVNLTIGIAVRQLIDLDEPNQVMKINLWIRLVSFFYIFYWNIYGLFDILFVIDAVSLYLILNKSITNT